MKNTILSLFLLTTSSFFVQAEVALKSFADISNFRQYTATFASSGQPSEEQFKQLARSGVERIIYLAFNKNETAIPYEDSIVKGLGMEYIHIPVDFMAPTVEDFELFASVMTQAPHKNTLVHCQVNFRASTFSLLYRVIYQEVTLLEAKKPFDSVWEPNVVWFGFLQEVLEQHGLGTACEGCDWGVHDMMTDTAN